MSSVIIELQKEVLDSTKSVLDLMRKAKLISAKLWLDDFSNRIKNELDWYKDEKSVVPNYRQIVWQSKALIMYQWRWVDVLAEDEKMNELITKRWLSQSISELEDLLQNRSQDWSLQMPYPAWMQIQMAEIFWHDKKYILMISYTSLVWVLSTVRDILLDRSMKLEKEWIVWEWVSFTDDEKEIAQSNESIHHYTQMNFYGDVWTVNNADEIHNGYSSDDLVKIIGIFEKLWTSIDDLWLKDAQKKELQESFDLIREESSWENIESGKIKKAISKTVWFLSSVASNAIASGAVEALSNFL